MKLAFCFLIYDIINHEPIWNIFLNNVNKDKYSIYIHYKRNIFLDYFDKYKLKNCIETKYSDISLVKAQNLLLEEGLKDKDNTHFIFISNSCIPVKSFDYIYNKLDEKYSYFNMCPKTQCFPKCNRTTEFIDIQYIQKASQWCILNRKHSELMLTSEYMKWFDYKGTVPDEHCYITNIYYHHLENEIINIIDTKYGTTFTEWNKGILKTYNYIKQKDLIDILQSPSLFARKFKNECYSSLHIKEYIDTISSKKIYTDE